MSALEDVAEMEIMYSSTDLVDSYPSGSNSKDEDAKEEIDEDRISKLPDVLLGQILSLLPSKSAVETCTLSKRWEYLWTLVENCKFDDTLYSNSTSLDIPKSFVDFGNNFLEHCCVNVIHKFHLTCVEQQCDVSSLQSWVGTAVSRNAQELIVDITGTKYRFELSESVFTCQTLRVLKIRAVGVVNTLNLVNLPSLKILHLSFPIFFVDSDPMEKLLPGCKILEELSLDGVTVLNLQRFSIRSSSLKRLRVKDCANLGDLSRYTLVTDCPQLEYLQIKDRNLKSVEANELPHLREADIMVTPFLQRDGNGEEFARSVFELFQRISNGKHLKLTWNIRNIPQSVREMLLDFKNLTSMEISIYEHWHLMILLLESAPNLKHLICKKVSRCYTNGERRDRHSSLCRWLPPRDVPKCLSAGGQLSEIEMTINGCESELQAAGYLLRNATALRTMRIGCATNFVKKWEDDILVDLLSFSRASTACEVEFP